MGLGRLVKKASHTVNRGLHKAANVAHNVEKGVGRGIRMASNQLGHVENALASGERLFNTFDAASGHLVSDALRATPLRSAYGEVKGAVNLARMGVDGARDLAASGGQLARAGINVASGHERRAMENLRRAGNLAAAPAVRIGLEQLGDARGLITNAASAVKGGYRAGQAIRRGDAEAAGRNLRRAYRNTTNVAATIGSAGLAE